MVDNHGHRLTNLAFFVPRFKMYNDAIRWRIVTMNGDRLPPGAELCVSFLDRVSCRIYCPFVPWLWQRQWWNFKSKFHYLAFQAMTFPDGVAGFEYGSMIEYVRAAHHWVHVTALQTPWNLVMGSCRIGVEWVFGKLKSRPKRRDDRSQ